MHPLVFSVTFCLFACFASATLPTFTGIGSQGAFVLLNEYFNAYKLLKPGVSFTYAPGGVGPSNAALTDNTADFVVSNAELSSAARASMGGDVAQIPFGVMPYVISYHLPYGDLAYASNTRQTVVLDRPTLGKIYALQITNWRDPEIMALQTPAVQALLPNATIRVGARTDASAFSIGVQQVSKAAFPSWPWGSSSLSWSAGYLNQSNVLPMFQIWSAMAVSINSPGAISQVPYTYVRQDPGYTFFALTNKNNDTMYQPLSKNAVAATLWNVSNYFGTTNLIDSSAPDAWPFISPNYLLFRPNTFKAMSCDERRELFLFFHWMMTDPWAANRMDSLGFGQLGFDSQVYKDALAALKAVSCPGREGFLLDKLPLPQHTSAGISVLSWLSLVFALIMVAVVGYYLYLDREKLSAAVMVFYSVLMAGALLNYLSIYFFYQVPSTDGMCSARVWLSCLGFTCMLSAIFCRGYQIRAVQSMAESTKLSNKVSHTMIQVVGNSVIIGTQIVILAAWSIKDPFSSAMDRLDPLNLTYEYICKSADAWVWWGLELAFIASLLIFGLYVVFITWELKHMAKESKWIAISIYNALVTVALLLALFTTLDVRDDTVFWLAAGPTSLLTTLILVCFFVPRLMDARNAQSNNSSRADSSHGSAGGKHKVSLPPGGKYAKGSGDSPTGTPRRGRAPSYVAETEVSISLKAPPLSSIVTERSTPLPASAPRPAEPIALQTRAGEPSDAVSHSPSAPAQ